MMRRCHGTGTNLARRVAHSVVTSERDFQCAAAQVSVVDFTVQTVSLEIPPTENPRLEMILRRQIPTGEARFPDHWEPNDFQKLGTMFLFPEASAMT